MPGNEASFAIQLPNAQPSLGNVLENGIQLNERRTERNQALLERQQEFQQRNAIAERERRNTDRLHNLAALSSATDYKQYATPDQHINDLTQDALKKIYQQGLDNIDRDPAEAQMLLKNSMGELVNWHSAATTDLQRIKQQQAEFGKTYPNTDLNQVTGKVSNSFLNNYAQLNQNGQLVPKPSHLVSQDVNYFDQFNNPKVLASVTNDASPVYDFFKSVPKTAFESDHYVNNRGKVVATKVGGYGTPYSGQVTGDDNQPIVQPNFVTAPAPIADQNGQPLRLADPKLATAMNANPKVAAGFEKLWNDEKISKGLQNIDPHTDEILKEHFRYQLAEKQLPHEVKRVEVQKTPITHITNNLGTKDITFNDVAKQVDQSLPPEGMLPLTALPSEAREFISTSVNKGRSDISHLDPSKLSIIKGNDGSYRVVNTDKDSESNGDVVSVFSSKGINLGTNSGQKVKQKILKEAEAKPIVQPLFKMK